jgi:hypothetical protein
VTSIHATDAVPQSGICSRCQHHTTDGVLLVVDQDSAAGGRILCCADIRECDQRRSLRALAR